MLRRSFLAAGGGAPLILGAENKSGSAKPVLGSGAIPTKSPTTGASFPPTSNTATPTACAKIRRATSTSTTPSTLPAKASDSMVVFDAKGKFVKSWGKEFKGGAHGLHIRKEGSTEYLYLCDTKRAVVVKTTLDGEEVFKLGYPSEAEPYRQPDGRRSSTAPPISPSPPTATSTSATATAPATSTNTTPSGEVHPHLRR